MGWRRGASALAAAKGGVAGAQARAAKKYRTAAERRRISGSDSGVDSAAAQASAPLLWGTGAELAVAGAGDGAGRPEADGGEQGTPAKAGTRSCRRHAGRTGVALFVGAVAGAHPRAVCAQV